MPAALPFIGIGLGALQAYQSAKQQAQQGKINEQTLEQLQQQRKLGRLIGGQGAVGNPFSPVYRPGFEQMTP